MNRQVDEELTEHGERSLPETLRILRDMYHSSSLPGGDDGAIVAIDHKPPGFVQGKGLSFTGLPRPRAPLQAWRSESHTASARRGSLTHFRADPDPPTLRSIRSSG